MRWRRCAGLHDTIDAMKDSLFRREVLEARRGSWLGGISLSQPLKFWVLASFCIFSTILVMVFLCFAEYSRRTPVTGQLVPVQGLSVLIASTSGVVTQVHVAEGEYVDEGDPVITLKVPRSMENSVDVHAVLESHIENRIAESDQARNAQVDLLAARRAGLERQLNSARKELDQIVDEVDTRRQQVALAKETLERLQVLHADKYVSDIQMKQQEAAVLDYISEAQILERQVISSQRLISQVQQALAEIPSQLQSSHAEYGLGIATLEQERLEYKSRNQLIVTASVAGVVSAHNFKVGQSVQAGQILSHVVPGDGLLEAEFLAPSSAVGFVRAKDRVKLRYQSYPYQKFGHQNAIVDRISDSALSSSEFMVPRNSSVDGARLYRITVSLESQIISSREGSYDLKPGMVVDAEIIGERRRLIEWITGPFNSFEDRFLASP